MNTNTENERDNRIWYCPEGCEIENNVVEIYYELEARVTMDTNDMFPLEDMFDDLHYFDACDPEITVTKIVSGKYVCPECGEDLDIERDYR